MTIQIKNCRFCGRDHDALCPSVKAIEYFEDGMTVKRVEFKGASDYYVPPPPQFQSSPIVYDRPQIPMWGPAYSRAD